MPFSRRSEAIPADDAFQAARQRVAARGGPRWDLTASNPTRASLDEPHDLASQLVAPLGQASGVYEPAALGAETACAEVAALWTSRGYPIAAADVFLTSSTSEAYAALFKLLCDAGDEVLVPAPSYPLLDELARYEQVRLVPYPLAYDGAWAIDVAALKAAKTDKTRAAIVVSPNNPTGNYARSEDYAALMSLGVPIISDEVFRDYPLGVAPPAAGSLAYAESAEGASLVFCLDGLSKFCGLPQAKLAWTVVAGPVQARREALRRMEFILDAQLSVASPVQEVFGRLLSASEPRRLAIQRRVRANYRWLRGAVAGTAVTCLHSEGGWTAVLQLPNTKSEEEWCVAFLDELSVLVQPGWYYDFPQAPFVVVSLLTVPATFREGMSRLLGLVAQAS